MLLTMARYFLLPLLLFRVLCIVVYLALLLPPQRCCCMIFGLVKILLDLPLIVPKDHFSEKPILPVKSLLHVTKDKRTF